MAKSPDFLFTYYRPWEKDSSLIKSLCDYSKDVQKAEFQAEMTAESIRKKQPSTFSPQPVAPQTVSSRHIGNSEGNKITSLREPHQEHNGDIDSKIMAVLKRRLDFYHYKDKVGIGHYSHVTLLKELLTPLNIEDSDYLEDYADSKHLSVVNGRLGYLDIGDEEGVSKSIELLIYFKNYSHYREVENFRIVTTQKDGSVLQIKSVFNKSRFESTDDPIIDGRPMLCNVISVALSVEDLETLTTSGVIAIQFDNVWIEAEIQIAPEDYLSFLYLSETEKISPEAKQFIYEKLNKK